MLAALVTLNLVPSPPAAAAITCGSWRWDVKTLSEAQRRQINFRPQGMEVARFRHLPRPGISLRTSTPPIWPVEKKVYRIKAQVIEAKVEEDSDIHLIIASRAARARTMIVEFPNPACVASPFKRPAIRSARNSFLANCGSVGSSEFTKLRGDVTVTGVGFWDERHGQTGVAPNAIELHPVLRFQGTCAKATSGGGGGGGGCSPAYPTVCIPPPPPDLDCADIPYTNFKVLAPDPHHFDSDGDHIGCET